MTIAMQRGSQGWIGVLIVSLVIVSVLLLLPTIRLEAGGRSAADEPNRVKQRLADDERFLYGIGGRELSLLEAVPYHRPRGSLDEENLSVWLEGLVPYNTLDNPPNRTQHATILQSKGQLLEPVRALAGYKAPGLFYYAVENSDVRAIYRGSVVYADWFRGYGYLVILNHDDLLYSLYGHNHKLLVTAGDRVRSRQIIAKSGNTGTMDGASGLYFEVRRGEKAENPRAWLVGRQ